jgi:acetyltransferase-like isoleucine patch superfamily enzyme
MFRYLIRYIQYLFTKYVICKGSVIQYLRNQGARIGENCSIASSAARKFGSEPWLIRVGDHVRITAGVVFITHDGSSWLFRDRLPNTSPYGNRFGKIVIHDNCNIGLNCIIMPDVTIGPNSIVGAGSVVTKDVPPNTVVAGVPARPICTLDEYIEKYKQKMIPTQANTREELQRDLTLYFWGEEH